MPRKKRVASLRCPTCRKLVLRSEPEFPFCSERCRTIDLGKWASGAYVISAPLNDPNDLDALDSQSGPRSQIDSDRNRDHAHSDPDNNADHEN